MCAVGVNVEVCRKRTYMVLGVAGMINDVSNETTIRPVPRGLHDRHPVDHLEGH